MRTRRLQSTLIISMLFGLTAGPALAAVTADGVATEDRFISRARQLTFEGRRAGEGYFSPDGRYLIFQSERIPDNPFFQIYILDFETGDTHQVSPGIGKTTCAFFRPGTDRVLFASTHLDPDAKKKQEYKLKERASGQEPRYAWDYDVHMDIFSANRDGSELKRLTDAHGYDAEGAYSPNGKKIIFCSFRDQPADEAMTAEQKKYYEQDPAHFGEIYIMDADGSNQTRLTDWPGYDGGPFFTPDGERVVWRHFEPGTMKADVFTMKLDGSDRRRLTDFGCMSWAPYFHPSGKYCIFNSNKQGMQNWELYMVDPMGEKEPVRVTYTEGADVLPVFSPDGERLCWTSTRHGAQGRKGQLFIGQWDHEAALAAIAAAPPRKPSAPEDASPASDQPRADKETKSNELSDYAHEQRMPHDLSAYAQKQREIAKRLTPAITEEDLRAHVGFLAADELEGRLTGTPHARAAAEYIAARFQAAGLKPLGDDDSYYQRFDFASGVRVADEGNQFVIKHAHGKMNLERDKDYRPLGLSQNGSFEGAAVFAGYGIVTDDYDAYGDLDVEGKCVVVLRYFPEDVDTARKTELTRYANLRDKAMHARNRGAKALLVVTGPRSPKAGELLRLGQDGAAASSGIVAASLSLDVFKMMLHGVEGGIEEIQQALDQENPHVKSAFEIPGCTVQLDVNLVHEQKTCQNVVGLLPATAASEKAEYVVLGAHYDHLGHGQAGSSFGYDESKDQIYNGADDNASGVATILELAAHFAATDEPRKDHIIFAGWSGEEIGLLGSEYFVGHSPVPVDKIEAYINFDMVGRVVDNKLIVQGVGSSPGWRSLFERRNVPVGFNLTLTDDPYLPTDTMPFYRAEAPVVQFFTGSHQDYHTPQDTAEKINYPDMVRMAKLAGLVTRDLATADEQLAYAKVERKTKARTGGGMRAYTGTEPDYAYSGDDGMRLKAVIPGGPAEKAGIQAGDKIVEIDGMPITNVYEYAHALGVLKPEKTVKMAVLRGDERIELTITPGLRE